MHANGGIINGSVACVGANYGAFLLSFLRVSAIFFVFCTFLCVFFPPKWPAKKREFVQNPAKMCKKRFCAIPPLVIPPFACHREMGGILFREYPLTRKYC